MKTIIPHTYMCKFPSGNVAQIVIRKRLPCEAKVHWHKRPSSEDLAEWGRWSDAITETMTQIDGLPHEIVAGGVKLSGKRPAKIPAITQAEI